MISYLIIEDDQHTVTMLKDIVHHHFSDINFSGRASSIVAAIELLKTKKPDFIFLDVNLDDGESFDILKQFPNPSFKVIFITSYSQYAVDAFKFSALDFILKPFDAKDIIEAVEKVTTAQDKERYAHKIEAFFHNYTSSQKKIVLSNAEDIHIIELNTIIYAESDNNYTTFHINDGRKILISKSLKHFEIKLANSFFFRIHQKYLLNTNYIKQFRKRTEEVILTTNINLPVSQSKKSALLHYLSVQ